MAKIVKIEVAYEVPDDFNWELDNVMDRVIDIICPIRHTDEDDENCRMVSMFGQLMTEEQYDHEQDVL